MISISQIYIDKKTEAHLDPDFYPLLKEERDEYFENSIIKKVYDMPESLKTGITYQGVTSWQQQLKTRLTGREIISYIKKDLCTRTQKDVYLYTPVSSPLKTALNPLDSKYHAIIEEPDIWNTHQINFPQAYADMLMLNRSGILPFDILDGKWQYCYCNYWIATPQVYNEYCETVLIPAMKFYEDPRVKPNLKKWYIHRHEEKIFTSLCFIFEGLFGAFLAHNNYTFDYIVKKKVRNVLRMITIDGYTIKNNPIISSPC